MKRLLALFALFGVFFSQLAYASFSDVNENHPYFKSIEWMQNNGVVSGKSKGFFQPNECLRRAESLMFLYKSKEVSPEKAAVNQNSFTDVNSSHWAYDYIEMAKKEGLIQGFSDGSFRPNDCMSRAEAISLALSYYLGSEVYTDRFSYADFNISKDEWFYDSLSYALEYHLVGMENEESIYEFDAKQAISRAETAELIYRLKTFTDNDIWAYQNWYYPYPLSNNYFSKNCTAPLSTISTKLKVESMAPSNSQVFLSVNHSNPENLANLEALLGEWPSPAVHEFLKSMWKGKQPLDFLEGKSKLNFALNFSSDDLNDFDFYLSGSFEDTQAFMDFMAPELQKDMPAIECSLEKDALYWTSPADDFYMASVGKYFLITNTAENREAGLERLRNQSGYQSSHSEKLMFFSVNMEEFSPLIAKEYEAAGLGFMSTYFEDLQHTQGTLSAEQKGFRLSSEMKFKNNKSPFIANYENAQLSLINRIPGENVVMYQEDQDLSMLFEILAQLMDVGSSDTVVAKKMMPKMLARDLSTSYEFFLTDLTKDLSLSPKEFDQLLNSPYALALSDVEGLIPGISFYLDLTEEEKSLANRFSEDLDTMIDEFITTDLYGTHVRENIEGTDLRRVTSSNILGGLFETIEINYGLSKNGDYIFALYPNFEETLTSSNMLAQNERFKQALRTVKGTPASVSYIDVKGLLSMLEENALEFNEVKSALNPFEFMVTTRTVKNNSVIADSYFGR